MAETQETTGESAGAETGGESAGQSVALDQTTVNGTGGDGESFFDYESIKGTDLEPAYKEMQRAFGKKSEAFKAGADKITQYDQFMTNPVETMRQLAQQYGYQMVQGEPKTDDGKPKSYNSWEEVEAAADERADKRMQEKFGPLFGEMQNMKKQNVEAALDNSYPDWRTYEDTMMENLKAHPTLVNDHDKLYQMSVPQSVLDARATKAALAKIQGTNESRTVQGQSTTTQQTKTSPAITSFDDAVVHARQELARQGLSLPTGD